MAIPMRAASGQRAGPLRAIVVPPATAWLPFTLGTPLFPCWGGTGIIPADGTSMPDEVTSH